MCDSSDEFAIVVTDMDPSSDQPQHLLKNFGEEEKAEKEDIRCLGLHNKHYDKQ